MKLPTLLLWLFIALASHHLAASAPARADGNRLVYLDSNDPFYVHGAFPKLTTPQWIGEPGVEAVVTLGIDDMRGNHLQYEAFLRPILERLKQIDGRAAVSIFCNAISVNEPLFQKWIAEGVSLECHTLNHPCPILSQSNFTNALNTFHGCVDLLNSVPNNRPVAFRTPCCDSINSPSPRMFAEIFNGTNAQGQFLQIDSSIMNVVTESDPDLPREWLIDADGKPKFKKYLPFPSFMTTVENYPYPFVIGNRGWEMPPSVPSDWEAHNLIGDTNPVTLADWKTAINIAVRKKGTFNLVFHPYKWSDPAQIVQLIDDAVARHGKKVKFLNFREVNDRLTTNLLSGVPLRAADGGENGVRLIDLNHDGYLDVVIGNEQKQITRTWQPEAQTWRESPFPTRLVTTSPRGRVETGVRFGVIDASGAAIAIRLDGSTHSSAWRFADGAWIEDRALIAGLEISGQPIRIADGGRDRGARLRDLNRDGICEFIISNDSQNETFTWSAMERKWKAGSFKLPDGFAIADPNGADNGLRFVDVNEDGFDDLLLSNPSRYALRLFIPKPFLGWQAGWTREVMAGPREDPDAIPMIIRGGPFPNNGAWFKNRHLWIQNEDTAELPDLVDRRSFDHLIRGQMPPAKSPEQSRQSLRLPPGFKADLVAHEPMIQSPVAFDWAADGKLYVVEFHDYPLPVDGKPAGIIKQLEDRDRDGVYETASVFLDKLNAPTGVMAWRNGILVSAAPHIIYAEDADGDGRAERRKILFEGFVQGNEQHRVNGFEYGLDGWVYGANGDSGGLITSLATGKQVSIRGRDFRFNPDTGAFETVAGQSQFGRRRDDWGNWFGNHNAFWGWHVSVPERYLARNTRLPAPAMTKRLANYPESTRLFPVSKSLQRFNTTEANNHVTAANSPTPYRDTLFGPDYANALFISEPVYNVVHREMLMEDGVSFKSQRSPSESDSEFLASTDAWFRPTMLKTGPDGALYIADMHRLILEHPEWIPDDLESRIDLRAGADKGRLYRVYPSSATLRPVEPLHDRSTPELVSALKSDNGWQRDTAQRLIIERNDRSAIGPLETLLDANPSARTTVQALHTLALLNNLSEERLVRSLDHEDPRVREHAILLAEPALRSNSAQRLPEALLARLDDPNARVQYQLAFSLGEWNDPRAAKGLAALARSSLPEIRLAVASSITRWPAQTLQHLMASKGALSGLQDILAQCVEHALAQNRDAEIARALVQHNGSLEDRAILLGPVLKALTRQNKSWDFLLKSSPPDADRLSAILQETLAGARELLQKPNHSAPERLAAAELLGSDRSADHRSGSLLVSLLRPTETGEIQDAALRAIATFDGAAIADELTERWNDYSPGIRQQVTALLLRRTEWSARLLDAVARGKIHTSQLSIGARHQLLTSLDSAVRQQAERLFTLPVDSDKDQIVRDTVASVAARTGRIGEGGVLFQQHCAACHSLGGSGESIAPDLAGIPDKSPERLLTAIIDPNRAVEDRYQAYNGETAAGDSFTGMILSESANSLTIAELNGQQRSILRADLKDLSSSGKSLMPEGFENAFDAQAFADLIAFIATVAEKPKVFAGNQPDLIRPDANGALQLSADRAEIYGETLAFETEFENLGFWSSANDRAIWTAMIPEAGAYEVRLEWACANHSAGNHFTIRAGESALAGQVSGTGGWQIYRTKNIGRIELQQGQQKITVRAESPLRNSLLDLKRIELLPAKIQDRR